VVKADAWQREGRCQVEIDHSKGNGQMNKSRRSPHIFVFAFTMLVTFSSPSPAQVRVLISRGFSAPYQELLPQFEKSTGILSRVRREFVLISDCMLARTSPANLCGATGVLA
jgi:hypothetical protein